MAQGFTFGVFIFFSAKYLVMSKISRTFAAEIVRLIELFDSV